MVTNITICKPSARIGRTRPLFTEFKGLMYIYKVRVVF